MTPNLQKCKLKKHKDIQVHFKGDDIHKHTTPQPTHLSGIAVEHAWVYNLMCIPLLTVLPSKREMHTLLDMCWIVYMNMCTSW